MEPKAQILVVDDDPDILATSRIILETHGYEVFTAANSREAERLLADLSPDLILLDVMMGSETEGFEFAYRLREDPRLQGIPVIMLTSFLDKVRAEGPGPFEFILGERWPVEWLFEKPLDTTKLLAKIEAVLKDRRS